MERSPLDIADLWRQRMSAWWELTCLHYLELFEPPELLELLGSLPGLGLIGCPLGVGMAGSPLLVSGGICVGSFPVNGSVPPTPLLAEGFFDCCTRRHKHQWLAQTPDSIIAGSWCFSSCPGASNRHPIPRELRRLLAPIAAQLLATFGGTSDSERFLGMTARGHESRQPEQRGRARVSVPLRHQSAAKFGSLTARAAPASCEGSLPAP